MANLKHSFGGEWTREKLDRIKEYLVNYKIALKNKPFKLGYIDAFAGTGYVNQKDDNLQPFLPEFSEDEVKDFFEGSARIALQIDDPFDSYIFIEKDKEKASELESLKTEFPHLANRIKSVNQEANEYIKSLCEKDWLKTNRRAVMFLDPYGMQVNWQTIEAIAKTKAIDLWILFPLGVAVNRLLRNDGQISEMDWAIVGGESGYGARPILEEWVTEIRHQYQNQNVAFFFKQWGGTNKKKTGRLLEGKTWDEMPKEKAQPITA